MSAEKIMGTTPAAKRSSGLSRWIQADQRNPEKPTAQTDMKRVLAELRRENRLFREEREALKKATQFFAERSKWRSSLLRTIRATGLFIVPVR